MSLTLITKNIVRLLIGTLGVRSLTIISSVLMVRFLQPADYGMLAFAIAIASISAFSSNLGTTQTFIREGSKAEGNVTDLLATLLKFRLLLATLGTIVATLLIPVFTTGENLTSLLLVCIIPTIWGTAIQGVGEAYFQLRQRMQYISIAQLFGTLFSSSLIIAGLMSGWNLLLLAIFHGSTTLIGSVVMLIALHREVSIKSLANKRWTPEIFIHLPSFALTGLLTIIIPQLGLLILPYFTSMDEVGVFAAASRIPGLAYIIPATVAASFLPVLFKSSHEDDFGFAKIIRTQLLVMTSLGSVILIPCFLYPATFLEILFGSKWSVGRGPEVLSVMIWMVLLQSATYPLADALTTQGQPRKRFLSLLISALFGGLAFILLSSKLGAIGASYASIALQLVLLLILIIYLPQRSSLLSGLLSVATGLGISLAIGMTLRNLQAPFFVGTGISLLVFAIYTLIQHKMSNYSFIRNVAK